MSKLVQDLAGKKVTEAAKPYVEKVVVKYIAPAVESIVSKASEYSTALRKPVQDQVAKSEQAITRLKPKVETPKVEAPKAEPTKTVVSQQINKTEQTVSKRFVTSPAVTRNVWEKQEFFHTLNRQLAQPFVQKRFYSSQSKHSGQSKDSPSQLLNVLGLALWVGGTLAFIWTRLRDNIPAQIIGDVVENPVTVEDSGGTKRLIKDAEHFEKVGEKENGRMPGSVVERKGKRQYFVEKQMPTREAALNEVILGEVVHLIRGSKAPKTALKQTPQENGKAEFSVLSQIIGHGREDMEPGKDLEKLASRYDIEDELTQHPIRDAGVSLAGDMLFGKTHDTKLANLVAFRRNGRDGHAYYYTHSIDNEYGFREGAKLTLDPNELLSLVQDLNELGMGEKLSNQTRRLQQEDAGIVPDHKDPHFNEAMPLRGTEKAHAMRSILLPAIERDIPYVAKFYEDFAALDSKQLAAIPEKLGGFITEKEKQKYTKELLERQEATKQFIAANKEKFEELRHQREGLEIKRAEDEVKFKRDFCDGKEGSSILGYTEAEEQRKQKRVVESKTTQI